MDEAEEIREEMQRRVTEEAEAFTPGGGSPGSTIEWLFQRRNIPQEVKRRFWIYTEVKDLRLSNLRNFENLNTLLAQLDQDIQLYITEKGEDIRVRTISWLNQLKFLVRINLLASTGGEKRDMELLQTRRGEFKSRYEQKGIEEVEE